VTDPPGNNPDTNPSMNDVFAESQSIHLPLSNWKAKSIAPGYSVKYRFMYSKIWETPLKTA